MLLGYEGGIGRFGEYSITVLQFSVRLRNKRDFVLWYLCARWWDFRFDFSGVGEELLQDRSFILEFVRTMRAHSFADFDHYVRDIEFSAWCADDEEIIREIGSLHCASPRLRDDGDFVVEMCCEKCGPLDDASDRIKRGVDIVKRIIQQDGWHIRHADKALRKCPDLAWIAASAGGGPDALSVIDPLPEYSRQVIIETIRQHGWLYEVMTENCPDVVREDRSIAELVLECRHNLEDFGETRWRFDREMVLKAIRLDAKNFERATSPRRINNVSNLPFAAIFQTSEGPAKRQGFSSSRCEELKGSQLRLPLLRSQRRQGNRFACSRALPAAFARTTSEEALRADVRSLLSRGRWST